MNAVFDLGLCDRLAVSMLLTDARVFTSLAAVVTCDNGGLVFCHAGCAARGGG